MRSQQLLFIPFLALLTLRPSLALDLGSEQDPYGLGMGNAFSAIAAGTHAVQWNPAGVAKAALPMVQLGLGYLPGDKDLRFLTTVLYPTPDGTVFALSQWTDLPAGPASRTTYAGSVALPLNSTRDFLLGFNLKYIALSEVRLGSLLKGRGTGIDFGISYDLRRPQGTLASFALAVKDAATEVRFDDTDEQPAIRTFVLGAAYLGFPDTRLEADLVLADQSLQSSQPSNRFRLGAERFFGERFYSVRLGMDGILNGDGALALGFGYHPTAPIEVTYALQAALDHPDPTHHFSLVYRFDDPGKIPADPSDEKRGLGSSSSEIDLREAKDPALLGSLGQDKPPATALLYQVRFQADPGVFSPNSRPNFTILTFSDGSPSETDKWTLEFQDSDAQVVRHFSDRGPLPPFFGWDGRDGSGRSLPDGRYRIVLRTFTAEDRLLSDDSETVLIQSLRPKLDLRVDRFPISSVVEGGGANFTVRSVGLPEITQWRFEVHDTSGRTVHVSRGDEKVPANFTWNCRTKDRKSAPEGIYYCQLTVMDKGGNQVKSDKLTLTLDNTPPDLALKGSDETIDFADKKSIRFLLQASDKSGIARWKLEVTDENDNVLKIFKGAGQPPPNLSWDGGLEVGGTLKPGTFFRGAFTAEDQAGNRAKTDPLSVQADFQSPTAGAQMTLNLSTVTFAAQSKTLTLEARKEIDKAVASVRPYLSKSLLVVRGYAAQEEKGDLLLLSHGRAREVKDYLVKNFGVPEGSIYAIGCSDKGAAATAGTPVPDKPQGRALLSLTTQP